MTIDEALEMYREYLAGMSACVGELGSVVAVAYHGGGSGTSLAMYDRDAFILWMKTAKDLVHKYDDMAQAIEEWRTGVGVFWESR